jgi:thiazole synthase
MTDRFIIAGKTYNSHLLLGTDKCKDFTETRAAMAMKLGCAGNSVNTAIASANNPVLMASSMKKSAEAGCEAYIAGRLAKKLYMTSPSSPTTGMIG